MGHRAYFVSVRDADEYRNMLREFRKVQIQEYTSWAIGVRGFMSLPKPMFASNTSHVAPDGLCHYAMINTDGSGFVEYLSPEMQDRIANRDNLAAKYGRHPIAKAVYYKEDDVIALLGMQPEERLDVADPFFGDNKAEKDGDGNLIDDTDNLFPVQESSGPRM